MFLVIYYDSNTVMVDFIINDSYSCNVSFFSGSPLAISYNKFVF